MARCDTYDLYAYDNDNRLTGIDESGISSITLTRNAVGNITGATRSVPLLPVVTDNSVTLGFDAASQVDSFTYDPMGRLTADTGRTYSWDLVSRLTGYTEGTNSVTFTYDGLSDVLTRSEAGGTTDEYVLNYALGLPSISVVKRDGSDIRYYVHTPGGELLYSINTDDDSRSFYHFDEMGSTIFLTDDTGSVTDSYAYTPYGVLADSTGGSYNPFTYIGKYGVMKEGSSGLYRMRRRVYDSVTKRFISRDPVADQSNPKTAVPYIYAAANPLRYMDPMGEDNSDNASGNKPVPEAVKTGKDIAGWVQAAIGKGMDEKLERSQDLLDAATGLNTLNKFDGKGNAGWVNSALEHSKKLNKAKDVIGKVGEGLGAVGLVVDTYERGPVAVVEHVAEKTAEKIAGKAGGAVAGVLIEGYKTNEKVVAVKNDTKKSQQSDLDSYDAILSELKKAYFVDKTITYEQYEKWFLDATRTFDESLGASTESGVYGILKESAGGLKNMLGKLLGL